jgi:Kef-type K+ transport system membrane component KefB
MKTKISNYLKALWFKIMNDEMSRHEAIAIIVIIVLISGIIIDIFQH